MHETAASDNETKAEPIFDLEAEASQASPRIHGQIYLMPQCMIRLGTIMNINDHARGNRYRPAYI